MVGIFDSGRGGELAVRELLKLCPNAEIEFYADRENAPYGTKSEGELVELVKKDIDILRERGASRILMACCTASTVYGTLPKEYKEIAIPIIAPAAAAAVYISSNKKIAVISTAATARSGAFEREIYRYCPAAEVFPVACGELVTLVEGGLCDGCVEFSERENIKRIISPVLGCGADTVILGCTHFAALEEEIKNITGMNTVNSARIGAALLAGLICEGAGT